MVRWVAFLMSVQLAAFLVGGIPFGYLVGRLVGGFDVRRRGSGNIGATNVGRLLGFRYFLLVFVLDFLKGAGPTAAAIWIRSIAPKLFPDLPDMPFLPELAGFAAILGHVFPVYLNLRGGKGVATAIGVICFIAFWPMVYGLVAFALTLFLTRMVSVGSMAFAIVFAFARLFDPDAFSSSASVGTTLFVLVIALLILVRHWSNIGRIVQGTESQIRLPWSPR